MYFGQTDEEIYENVKMLNALARKVARIVRIVAGIVLGLIMLPPMFQGGDNSIVHILILLILLEVMVFISTGFVAKGYTWGWIWYKGKHNTKNLGSDMANIAKDNLTAAYLIGGRSGTKWSLISMLVGLMAVISISGWVGTYYRWKYEPMEKKLAKKLGK